MPFIDRNMKNLLQIDPWAVHDMEPMWEYSDLQNFRGILIEMGTTYWSQDDELYELPEDPENIIEKTFSPEECSDDVLERYIETIFFQTFMSARECLNYDESRIRQTQIFRAIIFAQLEIKLPQRFAVEYLPDENKKPNRLPNLKYVRITAENDEYRVNRTNPFDFRSINNEKPKPRGRRIRTAIKKPLHY